MNTRYCSDCGARVTDEARFCATCGAAQRVVAHSPSPVRQSGAAALPRQELSAAIAARDELGERMEDEVVETFLGRVEHAIDTRVEQRLRARGLPGRREKRDGSAIVLGIVSLGAGIPITGIAADISGIGGLLIAWAGIAAVNVAAALGRRRHD